MLRCRLRHWSTPRVLHGGRFHSTPRVLHGDHGTKTEAIASVEKPSPPPAAPKKRSRFGSVLFGFTLGVTTALSIGYVNAIEEFNSTSLHILKLLETNQSNNANVVKSKETPALKTQFDQLSAQQAELKSQLEQLQSESRKNAATLEARINDVTLMVTGGASIPTTAKI